LRQFIFILLFAALAATLIIGSARTHMKALPDDADVVTLTNFNFIHETGYVSSIELPASLMVPGGSQFVLEKELVPGQYRSIMIKTMFTGLKLYADGELIFEGGQAGSYPAWLIDPPTMIRIQTIPPAASLLRFEYTAPLQRSVVSIPVVMAGDEAALMLDVLFNSGILLLISLFLIFMGVVVPVIAGIFLGSKNEKATFIWLGLGALAFGLWGLGECDASRLIFPYPVLLYVLAYGGLFVAVIPLLNFGLIVIKPRHPWIMKTAVILLYIMVLLAFSLQIAGMVALSMSLYLFQILAPVGVAAFTITILWEYFRYKNKAAGSFALPGVILLLTSMLEVLNYNLHLTDMISIFSLSGIMVFMLMLAIIGVRYIRETVQANAEKKSLEDQVRYTNRQIAIQREQYTGITESMEQARKARHDMRHQLSVIQGFNELGDQENLRKYLEELISHIPMAFEKSYCENMAVNSVVAHYAKIAESESIDTDIKITIPEKTGEVPAMDLCVILGNLLENAIDACRHMKEGDKYIRIRTMLDEDTLSIVVTNSYDGVWKEKGGVYFSRKETKFRREGIGLASVKTVCEKHRGLVRIEAGKDFWKSSALIHM